MFDFGRIAQKTNVRQSVCIICSSPMIASQPKATREGSQCDGCQATWRARATVLAVMTGLGYHPTPLVEIVPDWSRIGVGLSDDPSFSGRFSAVWKYTNTYFDSFPRLDIRAAPSDLIGHCEFVVCSDVLEHVDPPYNTALEGLYRIIKPGGFAVVTVPMSGTASTCEYYKDLASWELQHEIEGHAPTLRWQDSSGEIHIDLSLKCMVGKVKSSPFGALERTTSSTILSARDSQKSIRLSRHPNSAFLTLMTPVFTLRESRSSSLVRWPQSPASLD